MLVNGFGLIDGQRLNVKIGVAAFGNAPICLAAGVCLVEGVATLMAEQPVEGLVEVHSKYSHAIKAKANTENPTTITAIANAITQLMNLSVMAPRRFDVAAPALRSTH